MMIRFLNQIWVLAFLLKFASGIQILNLQERTPCISTKTAENGVCIRLETCAARLRLNFINYDLCNPNFKNLDVCSFIGRVPVLCCPGLSLLTTTERPLLNRTDSITTALQPTTLRPSITTDPITFPITTSTSSSSSTFTTLASTILRTSTANPRRARVRKLNRISYKICEWFNLIYAPPPILNVTNEQRADNLNAPFMALVGFKRDNEKDFYCGGTLISEFFVISSAFCEGNGRGQESNILRLAHNDDYDIKQFTSHPDYDFFNKHNDIAFIESAERIRTNNEHHLGPIVIPACLSQIHESEISVEVFGYGKTSLLEASSGLMKTALKIMENENCTWAYDDEEIVESQICAYDPNDHGKERCHVDFGGPMIVRELYFDIIGIKSFGQYCSSASPGVYTSVYSYLDWIEGIVWPDETQNVSENEII